MCVHTSFMDGSWPCLYSVVVEYIPDELHVRDLKRGALALRDFLVET